MPDITMCLDTECPQKERCYRFTAKPTPYRQSYFMFSPKSMDVCQYFTPNDKEGKNDN